MHRVSHDLAGVAKRLTRIAEELQQEVEITQQVWKDAQARAFVQHHLQEIRPTIQQLVVGLSQTAQLFEDIVKKVSDPKQ